MLQLHTKQIVHRDLKSPNLLVDKHWRVKVRRLKPSWMSQSTQLVAERFTVWCW